DIIRGRMEPSSSFRIAHARAPHLTSFHFRSDFEKDARIRLKESQRPVHEVACSSIHTKAWIRSQCHVSEKLSFLPQAMVGPRPIRHKAAHPRQAWWER